MSTGIPDRQSVVRVVSRGVWYLGFWLLLRPSLASADLIVGAAAAACATWASLRLLPIQSGRIRLLVLAALLPRFVWQSVLAGIDVARRAFAPRLRLRAGFTDCPTTLAPGLARNTFATITSLLPGSAPVGDSAHSLTYHCLDLAQPVVEQLRNEQRVLAHAIVAGESHG
jgi:multicomponent Na+:H+ antiporter subunit E